MHKILIIFLLFYFKGALNAQTAVIKDPDGYCNIRKSASSQSEIIDTLSNNRIIFVFEDQAVSDWLPVDYKKGKETLSGYIHKSRITFLTSFIKFKQTTVNDSILKLQLDSFQMTVKKVSFNKNGRQLQYEKQQGKKLLLRQ